MVGSGRRVVRTVTNNAGSDERSETGAQRAQPIVDVAHRVFKSRIEIPDALSHLARNENAVTLDRFTSDRVLFVPDELKLEPSPTATSYASTIGNATAAALSSSADDNDRSALGPPQLFRLL